MNTHPRMLAVKFRVGTVKLTDSQYNPPAASERCIFHTRTSSLQLGLRPCDPCTQHAPHNRLRFERGTDWPGRGRFGVHFGKKASLIISLLSRSLFACWLSATLPLLCSIRQLKKSLDLPHADMSNASNGSHGSVSFYK